MKFLSRSLAAFALVVSSAAFAQDAFPSKPVRIVVPWTPGGLSDTVTRLVAAKLSEEWKQPVVVDNRPGANGNIGTDAVVRSKPDGYTLLNTNTDTDALNTLLYRSVPYDPQRDLVPVANMVTQPMVLMAKSGNAHTTLQQIIADAKSKPGQLTYASWGRGSVSHLAMELLSSAAGVQFTHIPYKGVAPAVSDVVGGHVPLMFAGSATAIAMSKAQKVQLVAIATKDRLPQLADVPTFAELGYPGVTAESWNGISAPAGTPAPIVQRINRAVQKALADPDVVAQITAQGATIVRGPAEQYKSYITENAGKWRLTVGSLGIQPE